MATPRKTVGRAVAGLLALALSACAGQEQPAPEPTTQTASQAPEWTGYILLMPERYSDVAVICDHGNRLYVTAKLQHNSAPVSSIAVVANDPSCGQ